MKLFYTMVFFVGLLANAIWSFGQTSPCSITRSGPGCINQPITFYSSCPDNYTHFLWYIDGTQVSTSQSYTHTFTSGGTHTVKLGASCSDGNCSSPNKPVYTQTTVYIESVPQPSITASTTQLCETGTVTLSVDSDYNNSGYDFLWRSVPAGFTGSGTSVTFNNVATTTTFYLKTSGEACSNESQITVNVSKTSLQPALGSSSFYHRQTLTASGGIRSGHYWEQSSTGKDVNNPVNGDYIVYESGDYYTRYYSAATNCWASPLGPVHVGINYTPPQAVVGQILKSGYNEVYFTNDEKNYIFSYADYYWVSGAGDNPSILRPYSVNGVVTGNKLYKDGVYYLKGKDRGTGTWGPTTTLSVSLRGDQGLNWVQSKIFDGTISAGGQNTDKSIAESKTYFDGRGNQLQAQVKSFASGKVLVTQQLRDRYDRVIGSTLPAPTASSEFAYNAGFVLNEDGDIYNYKNFDLANSNDPDPVSGTEEGTLGWFYSANNTLEPNVAKTKFPYSRTELYEDGTGEIRRVADVGEVLKLGSGNEIWNATYPVRNELNDYIQKRNIVLPGISTATSLAQLSVQQISRDQNKKFTIAWSDRSGKTIMSARFGTPGNYVLQVTNAISCSISGVGATKSGIFYLTNQQKVELDARYDATGLITNTMTGETYPLQIPAGITSGPQLSAGFYKVEIVGTREFDLKYTNYYLDVACQFYDDAGRLVSSVSPNGMKEWLSVTTNLDTKYAAIDKTTYQYNFRGWLMSVTEPDAGTTNYKYRSDGKIRFSQNAQQSIDKHFSYTHYDQLGRPVESGEYTGTQYTFASLNNQLEYSQQTRFLSSDTRDWVVTHYDFADGNFNDATGLGSIYAQDFVDGAVSWSENANIKTWYSYDELGRVTWMAQKPATLKRVFVVKYTYDFLGNVLTAANLSYDLKGVLLEQFYHYYEYDADKRLSKAYTSVTVTGEKKLRATYSYYLHGPLKRIELGDKIQGIDFVYNINGWLTQINHPDKSKDPGSDGNDAFGMLLNYYESDLTSVFQTGYNSSDRVHDPNSFHKLPGSNEKQSIAFEPKAAYRQNMLETLEQLKALHEKENSAIEETALISENDPAIELLAASMPMHEPDFTVIDTLAVASAKAVLYEQPMATNVVPDDVEFAALKAIFDNLGGTGWTKKTNWPTVGNWPATATSVQFATWFGVTVSNGDVVSINLPSNNMIGTIPAAIANLTELTSIYLQGNKISGSIPAQIGSLSKLTLLYLYSNSLSGTIPPSLGNLKQLVYLALFRNTLTGSIPAELGSLTSLQTLRLDENSLSGTIPAALGNLTNLNYLNFYKNALTGPIPAEINSLVNLGTLNLSYNNLSGTIPNLSNLTKLTTFDIRSNPFSGNVPAWLGSIATLQYIYMGLNGLSGTIPASLGSLQNLKVLAINANTLTGTLPPELGELSNLEELYLYQNQLSGELPPSYGLLTKLKIFNLSQNKLTGNIPESYRNLTELTYFSVQTNQLSGELPDIFSGWTKATSFYVTANQFTGAIPASVGNMINLTTCYLSNNAFTSAPASLLNLTKAQALVLEANKLHSIPDFTTMPNKAVLYLYVRNNYLNAADLEPLYTAANASPFRTLYATPQLVDPGARISVPQGQSLTIMAEGKTANTTFVWEKQSGTTWTDVTSKSQSTNPDVFLINSPVASDAGIYRYRVTTSKITALSITSSPITVQTVDALPIPVATNNTLYNGLITSVQWRTDQAFSSTEGDYYGQYQYNYDDKYQLLEADYAAFNKTTKMFDAPGNNYRLTGMSYDPNGNIQSLKRYDGDGLYKNNLSYSYLANTNKLDKVNGYVNKFTYNAVGQMTGEDKESDTDQYVEYDVTGKVRKVFMDAAKLVPNAEYLYDDRGFRLAKINYQTKRTTWYIRDASGNILSIYEQAGTLPDPLQPINWTTLTNVVNTNGTLTLQSGATTGSAKASNTLAAGQDGYFEYILDDIQPVDIGFTVSGIGTCYFSVYPKPNANVVIRKAGALQASFTYSLGHKLKLEKVGDKLRFWQNGTLRLEITGVASSTAQLFANLTATGAILDNLTFKTISTTTDQASLVQTEVPIYGAGKLGTFYPAQDSSAVYELTDHLGNVRALVRENINTYTATMEDNGQSDLTNPRVTEMNYFRNIFETEVQDVQMNHTQKLAGVPQPDKAAYLYWISGTQGMDMQDKSVGPAISLKVNTGDKINLEAFARYEHKEDFTENVTLAAFSQLLGSTFAYVQGFEAMSANQATQTFQAALPALLGGSKDASQPSAFLNYIVFNKNMQSIASDRIQVSEAAAFEPDERAVKNMFEKLALNVTITEPGYIYAWVSNGSENTKVWFDDFRISHIANFVTQATDYGAWGDIIREQKTDDSEYRYSYQGQFSEKDLETGWSHFELREYDPIIGRWLVPDPMGQHWSPYIAMGNDPVNSVDPDGGKDGPGDECPECAGWGAMLPSVEVSGEFTGSIGGSLEGLHFAGLTGTGYTSYDDAGNWYQTINRMEGNLTYMYSNNEWSLYRDDARLKNAHLANVVSAADAVGKGTEFAISGALGGFGSALENTSLAAGRHYSQSLVPQIGNKLKYVFGQATGDAHNIERSTSMFAQLKKIGIFNNAAGNVYLRQHLGKVLNSSLGTMQSNGRILKESILMGPNGALKMESIWEGTKLITIKLIGG